MSAAFTYMFLLVITATLGFFAAAEIFKPWRNMLAAVAAVLECGVFMMLAWVFYVVEWGGVPGIVMAVLPVAGAGFAFRMAWKRWAGLPL